jgi:hypothetical protein
MSPALWEQRLDELENKLETILQQIEKLRRELQQPKPGPGTGAGAPPASNAR